MRILAATRSLVDKVLLVSGGHRVIPMHTESERRSRAGC